MIPSVYTVRRALLRRINPIVQCNRLASSAAASASSADVRLLREFVRKDVEALYVGNFYPPSARESYYAVRALNLELAAVKDAVRGNVAMGQVRFAFWRDLIDSAYNPEGSNPHPLFKSLKRAVSQHGHTKRFLERMVEEREADLTSPARHSMADLERYDMRILALLQLPGLGLRCRTVAVCSYSERVVSSQLYLGLEACGVRHDAADAAASHIGRAAGIATAMRALPVHARLSEQYVPDDVLRQNNLTFEQLSDFWRLPSANKKDQPSSVAEAMEARHLAGGDTSAAALRAAAALGIRSGSGSGSAVNAVAPPSHLHSHSRGKQAVGLNLRNAAAQPSTTQGSSASPAAHRMAAATYLHPSPTAPPASAVRSRAELVPSIQMLIKTLVEASEAHLKEARALKAQIPPAAVPALLAAVPISRFLSLARTRNYFAVELHKVASGEPGPPLYRDDRPLARVLLLLDLLWNSLRKTY